MENYTIYNGKFGLGKFNMVEFYCKNIVEYNLQKILYLFLFRMNILKIILYYVYL